VSLPGTVVLKQGARQAPSMPSPIGPLPQPLTSVALLTTLALLIGPSSAPVAAQELAPDTILTPPGGPTIALFQAGAAEVVSLRVSIPLQEAVEEAGAGQVLRIQARDRMETLARRVGAEVEVQRTPRTMVYRVSGAVEDLDFLGWILREGLSPPDPNRFESALREARTDLERRLETPEGALALRLLNALSPGAAPLQGSQGSLDRMDHGRLSAVWARSHVRSEARVVAAGRIETPVLLSVLTDLGLPDEGPSPQLAGGGSTGQSLGSPEVIRYWVADGYPLGGASLGTGLVAARLLAGMVRDAPGDYEASVEIWEIGTRRALVLSGAAYPRSRTALSNRLSGLVGEALEQVSPGQVAEAVASLEAEVRTSVQRPTGLAEFVGAAWDRNGDPSAADAFLRELRSVDRDQVEALLRELAGQSPQRQELEP